MSRYLAYAKAHVAIIGAAATWAVATFPDGQVARVAAAVLAVLTALGVYAVPNRPKRYDVHKQPRRDAGGVLIVVLVVIVCMFVAGLFASRF